MISDAKTKQTPPKQLPKLRDRFHHKMKLLKSQTTICKTKFGYISSIFEHQKNTTFSYLADQKKIQRIQPWIVLLGNFWVSLFGFPKKNRKENKTELLVFESPEPQTKNAWVIFRRIHGFREKNTNRLRSPENVFRRAAGGLPCYLPINRSIPTEQRSDYSKTTN